MSNGLPNTKKFNKFVNEKMVEFQSVKQLPGIGKVLGDQLGNAHFTDVCEVLELFKKMRFSEEKFQGWLEKTCPSANRRHIYHCVSAVAEWACRYLRNTSI